MSTMLSSRAHAGPPEDRAAEARVHFDRGVELYREGSYDAALAEFERTNELAPTYKIIYNIAQVQAERHEYAASLKLLREYLRRGGSEINADRREAVQNDINKLKQRVAELSVVADVDGAELFLNDVSVGRLPLSEPVLVNIGSCRVRLEKAGYVPARQTIAVAGGDRQRIALKLVPSQPLSAAALSGGSQTTASTGDGIQPNLTPFWISVSTAVALGAATGAFGALASGANGALDRELNQLPAHPSDVSAARSKLKTFAALTDSFAAGTILAAGAAVYFFIDPPQSEREHEPGSAIHARLGPSGSGFALTGSF
jgi:tetratricopeptide (TPR) repeat protein